MNEHLSGEALAAFADGRLVAESRRAAEAHLSLCRECRQELAEVVDILAGREAAPDEFIGRALAGAGGKAMKRPPAARITLLRPAFGVAAALLVAVVAGYFFIGRGRVQAPPAAERELPGRLLEPKAEKTPADGSSLKDAASAAQDEALSRPGEAPLANQTGTAAGTALKKAAPGSGVPAREEFAARKGEDLEAAPAILAEAPRPVPAAVERRQATDKREAAESDTIADGVVGGVARGSVEAQAPEKARMAAAPAPDARRRDLEATPQAKLRWHGPGDPGAVAGARQLFLAASGRAAAPPSLELVELAAGPLVSMKGDVALADVLPPGLRAIDEWLPLGAAVEVTVNAGGQVTSVRLLGEWRPGAAARARAETARLAFAPATAPERRVLISRRRLN